MTVVAAVLLALSTGAVRADDPDVLRTPCDADLATLSTEILDDYRRGIGDTTTLPASVDGTRMLLSAMRRGDQRIRFAAVGLMNRCGLQSDGEPIRPVFSTGRVIDRENVALLRRIIDEKGWPVIPVYGDEADRTAFLVAQHADRDVPFQRTVLALLTNLVARRQTSGENFALLFDRVRVADGKPQRFGSQGRCIGNDWVADRLEDSGRVDAYRRQVGLEPMRAYRRKAANILCGSR